MGGGVLVPPLRRQEDPQERAGDPPRSWLCAVARGPAAAPVALASIRLGGTPRCRRTVIGVEIAKNKGSGGPGPLRTWRELSQAGAVAAHRECGPRCPGRARRSVFDLKTSRDLGAPPGPSRVAGTRRRPGPCQAPGSAPGLPRGSGPPCPCAHPEGAVWTGLREGPEPDHRGQSASCTRAGSALSLVGLRGPSCRGTTWPDCEHAGVRVHGTRAAWYRR